VARTLTPTVSPSQQPAPGLSGSSDEWGNAAPSRAALPPSPSPTPRAIPFESWRPPAPVLRPTPAAAGVREVQGEEARWSRGAGRGLRASLVAAVETKLRMLLSHFQAAEVRFRPHRLKGLPENDSPQILDLIHLGACSQIF